MQLAARLFQEARCQASICSRSPQVTVETIAAEDQVEREAQVGQGEQGYDPGDGALGRLARAMPRAPLATASR
jgi:hypothetical protein